MFMGNNFNICGLDHFTSQPFNYSLLLLHRSRKDEIGEEIFDMLLSFSDFLAFKQMFLDYKAVSS